MNFKNKLIPVLMVFLRIAIGWHFLYEGLVKIFNPAWSAKTFLEGSRWIFGDFFRWLASGDTALWIVDKANAYGLVLIGLALILGLFVRLASFCGISLLMMYYLAYPPFGGFSFGAPSEGAYLIVNKNLIEILVLIVLAFSEAGKSYGLDMLIKKKKIADTKQQLAPEEIKSEPEYNSRRELLKGMVGIPVLAGFAGAFMKNIYDVGPDAVSGSTIKVNYKQIRDLKGGALPMGKIGNLNLSRLIMGCNLIGGWSHARDLKYTDVLFKAYNTEQRVMETLYLGEMAGLNTTFMVTQYYPVLNKYKKIYGGQMQSLCQTMLPEKDLFSDINKAIDFGATALYIHGGTGDSYIKAGKIDEVAKAIDYIKKQGFVAGMGSHSIEAVNIVENAGIPVDFYVKTFHHDKYWSATPEANRIEYCVDGKKSDDHDAWHENMFELFPAKTITTMKQVTKPWIAFKVLAAGAILPEVGFRYAFENGADFICVGMFDFQVIDDVNTANKILGSLKNREREWFS